MKRSFALPCAIIAGTLAGTSIIHARMPADDIWDPRHVTSLPAEVRARLGSMCKAGMAVEHYFALYLQRSQILTLHFEHFRCGDKTIQCNASGCLHQVYSLHDGRYKLIKSYYATAKD